MNKDFKTSISLECSESEAYQILTERISEWWSESFEGSSSSKGDVFTVRFGQTFKTMLVQELDEDKSVHWLCVDQIMVMPEGMSPLTNQKEWVGTKIKWTITSESGKILLQIIHDGLTPDAECWGVCEQGWYQSLNSLRLLANQGKGLPFSQLDEKHLAKARRSKA